MTPDPARTKAVWTYVARRLLYMIPTLFGVALLTFLLFTYFGEDPVRIALGQHAAPESIAALRATWGLDRPVYEQFLLFLRQIVTFDYGVSYATGESLLRLFAEGALVSLALTAPPFVLGTLIALGAALLISYYRGSRLDRLARIAFTMSMSISYLVYIIVFQYAFAFRWGLFPVQGYASGLGAITYLALPWLIMTIVDLGPDVRIYRTILLDEANAEYVRTARAKGASSRRVLLVHLLKNAMIPVITHALIAIPFLITGAFVMERYFSIPGIGDLTVTAIGEGDFPVIKGMTMLMAILYAAFNLLADILYAAVDPRIELKP